jgi:hypothetical protein
MSDTAYPAAAPPPPPAQPHTPHAGAATHNANAADECGASQEEVLCSPLLLWHILSGVAPDELAACSLVSHPWRDAALDVAFFRVLCGMPAVAEALRALPRRPVKAVFLSLVRKLDALLPDHSAAPPRDDDANADANDDDEALDDFRVLLELTTAAGAPVAGGVLTLRTVEGPAPEAGAAPWRSVCASGELSLDGAASVRVTTPAPAAPFAGAAVLPPLAHAPLTGARDVRNLRLRVSALRVSAAAVAPLWSGLPPQPHLGVDVNAGAPARSLVFCGTQRDVQSQGVTQGLPGFALDIRPPSEPDAPNGAATAALLGVTVQLLLAFDAGGAGTAALSRASVRLGWWVSNDNFLTPVQTGIGAAPLLATFAALDWEPLLLAPDALAPLEALLRRCALPECDATEPQPKAFKLCGRCRAAAYCSAAHQQADWRRHKHYDACAPPGNDSSSEDDDDAAALLASQRWPAHAAALALLLRAGRVACRRRFRALAAAMAARAAENEQSRYLRLHERPWSPASSAVHYTLLLQLHHGPGICFAAAAPLVGRSGYGDELRFAAAGAPQDAGMPKLTVLFHKTDAHGMWGAATPDAPDSPLLRVDLINHAHLAAHAWLMRQQPDGRVQLSRWAENMRVEGHCDDDGTHAFAFVAASVQPTSPPDGARPRGLSRHGPAALRMPPYALLCEHLAHRLAMDTIQAGDAAPPPPPATVLHTPYVLGGTIALRLARVPDERMARPVPQWAVYTFDGISDSVEGRELGLGLFNPAQPRARRLAVTQGALADVAQRMEWRTLVPPGRGAAAQ